MPVSRLLRRAAAGGVLVTAALPVLALPAMAAALTVITPVPFASANPSAMPSPSKPDDVTLLNGHLFTTFQNGVGPDGTPAKDGWSQSTIAEYDAAGKQVATYLLTGRCDGLTADPANNRVLATVNEDANSSLAIITPATGTISKYTYAPSPGEQTAQDPAASGGTDSISISPAGTIYVAHSAPNPNVADTAAVYTVTLTGTTAHLKKTFAVNSPATDAVTGQSAPLALTDPDSNRYIPAGAPVLGDTLLQVGQSDARLVEVTATGRPDQTIRQLTLHNAEDPSVAPTIDDIVEVTGPGTLYSVDQGAGTIASIDTSSFTPGTLVVAQPADSTTNTKGQLGVLDPTTGIITHFANTFNSPKGLAFQPRGSASPSPVVPEIASPALLPLAALGLFGATVSVRRHRSRRGRTAA